MYRFLFNQIGHFFICISFLSIASLCSGEVRINEISCKGTERLIRWDANDQPFAGKLAGLVGKSVRSFELEGWQNSHRI